MQPILTRCTIAMACAAALATPLATQAADWSDTSIGYRYGTKFAEPYNTHDITKSIVNFTHASGYTYGTNFLNVDMLFSDHHDSSDGTGSAQEVYVVYRHTLDLGKVTGKDLSFGPAKGVGLTGGFDFNTKSGDSYESKKRMWVFGPTLMMDVPKGFLNVSALMLWESNAPKTHTQRYYYDPHPMLNAAWAIPFNLGPVPLSFEGFANFIASKGKNEFGGDTKPETNIDMQVMYDVSPHLNAKPKTLKVGLEYQYWRNKFGNDHTGAAGDGAFAKTPMVRVEYHF